MLALISFLIILESTGPIRVRSLIYDQIPFGKKIVKISPVDPELISLR